MQESIPTGNGPDFFRGDHYLGKPADFTHRIVERRVRLIRQIPHFVGKTFDLLDVGCGNGATMFLLADEMKSCLGLDTEPSHSQRFNEHRTRHNVRNCEFRLFDIERQQLEREFERMISFEVIEHLRDERSVEFYFRALKPGGMLVITVPNKWWLFETHGMKLPGLRRHRVPLASWLPRFIHDRCANARIYTMSRIRRLLESAGFQVEGTSYITAPLDVLGESAVKRFLTRFIFSGDTTSVPFLSTSIMVICRRP